MDYEILSTLLSTISSVAVLMLTVFLFVWTQKRDKLEALRFSWQEAQSINLAAISDPELAEIMEKVVYGDPIPPHEQIQADYFLFLYLNRIRHDYLAFRSGLVDRASYDQVSRGTLRLIVGHKERVRYLLLERGYSRDYMFEIMGRLDSGEIERPRRLEEISRNN